jgi:hypothetical protein
MRQCSTDRRWRFREKGTGTSKRPITTAQEFMALQAALIDLYRHAGPRCAQRKDCAIKHNKFCGGLILKNIHTIPSVFDYDRAVRQIKLKSYNWGYDEGIGIQTLRLYIPKETDKDKSKGRFNAPKKVFKRKEREPSTSKSSSICYNYAEGGCHRTQAECRFHHGCGPCATGPQDKHVSAKCPNRHLTQRPKNGKRTA